MATRPLGAEGLSSKSLPVLQTVSFKFFAQLAAGSYRV